MRTASGIPSILTDNPCKPAHKRTAVSPVGCNPQYDPPPSGFVIRRVPLMARKQVFVAYSSKDTALSDGIYDAKSKANAKPLPVIYEPWVFNDVAGGPLISPIHGKIDDSPFVVADITYLNLNVVYEIGFAIGRGKRAFLVKNKNIEGDSALIKAVGIFDTLGYREYDDYDDLKDRLAAHIEPMHIPFSNALDAQFPVYIVEPSTRDDGIVTTISRIKKARYPYRSFHGLDDLRMSAPDTT